jgi:pilus assembly protein Flp/PilA
LDIMTARLWCRRLLVDDRGQDLIEYALLAGIIGIAGALVLPQIAPKMGNAFSYWGGQAYNAWTPSAPVVP